MSVKLLRNDSALNTKILNAWFDELTLPVAPACNMMCNFCSKNSDCICNGNNPDALSKTMTPRQAVNWAIASVSKSKRLKVIRISGPGEPLFNSQTFEVLKRMNYELPEYIYAVSTNGLLLEEKAKELAVHNVKLVDVCMNAVYPDTILKLYPRLFMNGRVVTGADSLTGTLLGSQLRGIAKCQEYGMEVRINTIYFQGVNEEDIRAIGPKCRESGIHSMRLISGYPGGKFGNVKVPSIGEMICLQHELLKYVENVEIISNKV